MINKPVYTFSTWRVAEGQLSTLMDLLPELIAKSTAEEGNFVYRIHQSTTDPNTLILFEGYKDEAALAAHRGSDHFKTFVVGKIVPILEERGIVVTTELFVDD